MIRRLAVRRGDPLSEEMEGAIDLVFLLLIFFVLSSSFQILVGAKIKPPKKVDEELVIDSQKDIVLKIDSLSQVVLIYQKQEYPLLREALFQDGTEKLRAFLSASKEAKVVVFADYDSPFGVVNTIELICTHLGVSPYICYERGQT